MERSVVTAVRSGSWRHRSQGWLPWLATAAAMADVVTTGYIFYSPLYWEGNLLLAKLAEIGPAVALFVFAGYCGVHVIVSWLSFGWFSDVVASFLVVSMGLGSLNNLVLFGTKLSLYARLGLEHATAIHALKPSLGILLGLYIASRRGQLPWREITIMLSPELCFIGVMFVM